MRRLVEVRTYRLKPGTEGEFHEAIVNRGYASDAWRRGPRQSIVELIETYQDTLIWLGSDAVELLRGDLAFAAKGN